MMIDNEQYLLPMVNCGKETYACSLESNIFCKIVDDQVEYITSFENERYNKRFLFADAILVEDRIYLSPRSAKGIYVFNISSGKMDFIELEIPKNINASADNKMSMLKYYKGKIFVMPATYPYIVVIDPHNLNIEYIKFESDYKYDFTTQGEVDENLIYLVAYSTPVILIFDMDLLNISLNVYNKTDGAVSVNKFDNKLYVTTSSSRPYITVINLDTKQKDIVEFENKELVVEASDRAFSASFIKSEFMYLIPTGLNAVIKFECKTYDYEITDIPGVFFDDKNLNCTNKDDKTLYFYRRKNMWNENRVQTKMLLDTFEVENITYVIKHNNELMKYIFNSALTTNNTIYESKLSTLNDFIAHLDIGGSYEN